MHLLPILTVLIGTWISWTAFSLLRNYQAAKSIKLPIVVSPTASLNPFWIITYKLLFPPIIPLLQKLPVGRWPRCTYMGWQFDDKHRLHDELGPAFVLCTPGVNEVIIADPEAVHHVLTKRKDFIKPAIMYDGLNAFGKNLDSVEGETWQRHRRITAPNFNEKVSASVWSESVRQASQMLAEWTNAGDETGTRDTVEDTASLALNVLTYAGFGIRYDFKDAKTKVDPPHDMSYRDALYCILRNYTLLVMFPMNLLKLSILPNSIRAVGKACDEFKLYMKETVDREKASSKAISSLEASPNLLSALVRASQTEDRGGGGGGGLTDEEIYGNIFIYNIAGHETTANTIATAIAYLALHPKWQDWLHEELSTVLPDADTNNANNNHPENENTYDRVYDPLKRCQAVMFETLRLHGSIVFLPKTTVTARPLTIDGRTHVVPPATFVVANTQALHCDPRIWGEDVLEWRPDRWITTDTSISIPSSSPVTTTSTTTSTSTTSTYSNPSTTPDNVRPPNESLICPDPGTFAGWADGPRICPGKKFSQVEFTGVMATLFRRHRVRAGKEVEGEPHEVTRRRLVEMIDDSGIAAITLQMRRPRDVALVWEAR